MLFDNVKSITIPEGVVKQIKINNIIYWKAASGVTYTPILPNDTAAYPMYLRDYEIIVLNGTNITWNNANENRVWSSNWPGHDQLNSLSDDTLVFSDLYTYSNTSLANVPDKSFSINRTSSKFNGNFIICDTDVTSSADGKTAMYSKWNAYLAQHNMKLLIPNSENNSIWFAVTDETNYGYYCPSTQTFMKVYGMTGTKIQRVEYIEFDGTDCYVNTGVNLTGADTVTVDFLYNKSGSNIFGSWRSSNTDVYTLYASTSKSYTRYGSSLYRAAAVPIDTRLTYRMTPTGNYVNGQAADTWTQLDFNTNTPCLVGWLNGSGSPHMGGNVYDFLINNKSHLIPTKIGNNYYLFDCLKWSIPNHVGTFTGGSIIDEPIEFPTSIPEEPVLLTMGENPNDEGA